MYMHMSLTLKLTCRHIYIGKSSLYELFPLLALANTIIQYNQIDYDADNIDNNK